MEVTLEHERRLAELRYSQALLLVDLGPAIVEEVAAVQISPLSPSLRPAVELLLREAAQDCSEAIEVLGSRAARRVQSAARSVLRSVDGRNLRQGADQAEEKLYTTTRESANESSKMLQVVEFAALVAAADAIARCGDHHT